MTTQNACRPLLQPADLYGVIIKDDGNGGMVLDEDATRAARANR